MKINLTKNQYRLLLERCFVSDWVINAYRKESSVAMDEQKALLQYLLSFAKDFDCRGNTTYSKEEDALNWAGDYLEKHPAVQEFLGHYNGNLFTDLLSDRLAGMALEEKYSQEEIEKMDSQELSKQFMTLKQQALASSSLLQDDVEEGDTE